MENNQKPNFSKDYNKLSTIYNEIYDDNFISLINSLSLLIKNHYKGTNKLIKAYYTIFQEDTIDTKSTIEQCITNTNQIKEEMSLFITEAKQIFKNLREISTRNIYKNNEQNKSALLNIQNQNQKNKKVPYVNTSNTLELNKKYLITERLFSPLNNQYKNHQTIKSSLLDRKMNQINTISTIDNHDTIISSNYNTNNGGSIINIEFIADIFNFLKEIDNKIINKQIDKERISLLKKCEDIIISSNIKINTPILINSPKKDGSSASRINSNINNYNYNSINNMNTVNSFNSNKNENSIVINCDNNNETNKLKDVINNYKNENNLLIKEINIYKMQINKLINLKNNINELSCKVLNNLKENLIIITNKLNIINNSKNLINNLNISDEIHFVKETINNIYVKIINIFNKNNEIIQSINHNNNIINDKNKLINSLKEKINNSNNSIEYKIINNLNNNIKENKLKLYEMFQDKSTLENKYQKIKKDLDSKNKELNLIKNSHELLLKSIQYKNKENINRHLSYSDTKFKNKNKNKTKNNQGNKQKKEINNQNIIYYNNNNDKNMCKSFSNDNSIKRKNSTLSSQDYSCNINLKAPNKNYYLNTNTFSFYNKEKSYNFYLNDNKKYNGIDNFNILQISNVQNIEILENKNNFYNSLLEENMKKDKQIEELNKIINKNNILIDKLRNKPLNDITKFNNHCRCITQVNDLFIKNSKQTLNNKLQTTSINFSILMDKLICNFTICKIDSINYLHNADEILKRLKKEKEEDKQIINKLFSQISFKEQELNEMNLLYKKVNEQNEQNSNLMKNLCENIDIKTDEINKIQKENTSLKEQISKFNNNFFDEDDDNEEINNIFKLINNNNRTDNKNSNEMFYEDKNIDLHYRIIYEELIDKFDKVVLLIKQLLPNIAINNKNKSYIDEIKHILNLNRNFSTNNTNKLNINEDTNTKLRKSNTLFNIFHKKKQ